MERHRADRTRETRSSRKGLRRARAVTVVASAVLCSTLFAAPSASADVFDDAGCEASAMIDRRDGSTSTYGSGWLECDAKQLDAVTVDVKLYKGSTLRARGNNDCGLPVHAKCAASTELVTGSSGTWKVVVRIEASIDDVFHRDYTVTRYKTW